MDIKNYIKNCAYCNNEIPVPKGTTAKGKKYQNKKFCSKPAVASVIFPVESA